MSSDYFFRKWKDTLSHLDDILDIDSSYQELKVNDKTLCQASERLSGMLAQYIAVFNDALDCKQHNAQVQKIPYLNKVVHAISQRILELKQELRKLDGSNYQFLANGMKTFKITPQDAEFTGVPDEAPRSEQLDAKLKEIFLATKEEKERIRLDDERKELETEEGQEVGCWWDAEDADKDEVKDEVEEKEKLTEEQLKTREMAARIQAQERSRQLIRNITKTKQQRARWVKELNGTLPPPARLELKERAAKLIQMAARIYFEEKRRKIDQCNRDKLLGIQYCKPPKFTNKPESEKLKSYCADKRKKYTKDWRISFESFKLNYLKEESAELTEYYRDVVRDWFYSWFHEIQYFHEIPNDTEGGVVAIIKEEIPSPGEWLEEYKKVLEQQKADKGKSAQEKKFAAQEAKREKMMQKKEEQMKMKLQAQMMKKLMKNPNQHPGYNYPKSDKLSHIMEAIEEYRKYWDELDKTEIKNIKEKFIYELDISDACKEVKVEVCDYVYEDMNKELKLLKAALKTDYMNMGEKMLEPLKAKNKKKGKKKKKLTATMSEHIAEQLQSLAIKDILKEYPRTSLDNFMGDQNLVGDDVRCNYGQAFPFAGETRSLWWERCREVVHGNHKVLIVGPPRSGKTTLVHALASLNDAVLFEVDPCEIPSDLITPAHLQPIVAAIGKCAEVLQPSVIYIRNIHRLYYIKKPKEIADLDTNLLRNYFVRKLCKRFNKSDKVTIIGTCIDPWLVKAKLLKQFPVVLPIPDTSYSTVYNILYEWVTSEHSIPNDLDIHSLARALQGYSFGYIQECLKNFLSPTRIVHIAAHGLKPQDVYDHILGDNRETKIEYDKYMKWYFDKTSWGQKEKKHHADQLEFKAAIDKYAAAAAKKMKSKSGTSSATSLK